MYTLSIFTGWKTLKPTANPGRRFAVMKLVTAVLLEGHDYSKFRSAVGKLVFIALCRPDMQFAIQQPQSHSREQARSETVDTMSQRHAQHLSSSGTTHHGSKRND